MEVILLERIERLGGLGDVVKVKPGFARNFLLPQKKALRATPENIKYFEAQRAQLEAANQTRRQEAEVAATGLDGQSVTLVRQAGESGQLYGSVTTRDIVAALKDAGHAVERRQVYLGAPIKELGVFPVRIALHPEVSATVTVNVAKSEEEAQFQLQAALAPPAEETAAETAEAAEGEAKGKGKKRKTEAAPELPPGADTAFDSPAAGEDGADTVES